MSNAMAVLSYTRTDDNFFGGYITAFRKTLETAVHVVSGAEDFRIFQDIEGIVLGEQWQKKLADVIGAASFFVPMISPLYFASPACREEVDLFLAHERELDRDDLVLPVYFLSSAKLEKDEEKTKDPLAMELARRQMFDWREKANLPLQEPAARQAILMLAGAIVAAIGRLEPPVASRGTRDPEDRGIVDDTLIAAEYGRTKRERLSQRTILWVDDRPDNNAWERRALESYGVRFVLARDTAEAEALLRDGTFAAVISDMGRPGDRQAGYTLLDFVRAERPQVPYFIYSGSRASKHVREARERGAQGATNDPDNLVDMVVAAIR